MSLNNGSMNSKNYYISFVNKKTLLGFMCLLLLILVPCGYFVIVYWTEMPLILKIICPILTASICYCISFLPFNGMQINKKGFVLFIPDIRIKRFEINNLDRVAVVFKEWDNDKYSAMIKFVNKNGKLFTNDYSKNFDNRINKRLAMRVYTISKSKVDKICKQLLSWDIFTTTIIDKNKNIVYQK